MQEFAATPPKVFISYSHDSAEHKARVLALSNRLRSDGVDATIDQYEVSPPEGWPVWMEQQIRESNFVLVVCTETYLKRAERREESGKGHGVMWESVLSFQQIYDAGSKNIKFIPVLLAGGDRSNIPAPLKAATSYDCSTEEGYWELYARLTNQHGKSKPELGKLKALPVREAKQIPPANPVEKTVSSVSPPGERPLLWSVPHDSNPVFTGREDTLQLLEQDLANIKRQALYGLGGIGKTQIAVEYAYRHRHEYTGVFWIFADSEQSASTSFIQIAKLLNLPVQDLADQAVIVGAVKRWLEQNDSWLLILDNLDHPETVQTLLPQRGSGHILITSRARNFQMLSIFKPIEIFELPVEPARQFLLKRTARDASSQDVGDIDALTSELGYFPLALEQAGAFIYENQTSFADYLKSYRKRRIALLEQHVPVIGRYKETVATTWAINFAEVEKIPASADLLRLSAFLAPAMIPLELLEAGKSEMGEALASQLYGVAEDPVILDELLKPLTDYSLIRRNTIARSYSIHPLVQEVIRANMTTDTQRSWEERTVRGVSAAFPDPEFENWRECARLLSHALQCEKYISTQSLESATAATLLRNAGFYLHRRAQYAAAEPLYKLALAMREKVCGQEHSETADILSKLAWLYSDQGKYAKSELLDEQALKIREKVLGPDHSETATSLNNLATTYEHQGKYSQAELLFQRALHLKEKTVGPEHPDTATAMSNLAALYQDLRRYTDAEPLLRQSLLIREKILGAEHPDTATSLQFLAGLYQIQHRYDEAELLIQKALRIREQALGPEHPDTARSLQNLASLCADQDKYDEADLLSQKALRLREKVLGPEHPDTANSLYLLARVYRGQRKYDEAEVTIQKVLQIREHALGSEHPDTAGSLKMLGNLYYRLGKYKLAEPLLLRASAIELKTLGFNPDTISTLQALSTLYRKWGKVREANKYDRRLKEILRNKRK